ncbi:MAG: DUF2490 domain-containing protein [Sphingobacteriales bacterium]|nr:DUF2490 domain-containing protein [Sphingobacteriales bacterium]
MRQHQNNYKAIWIVFFLFSVLCFSLGAQQHQFSGWVSTFKTIKLDKKHSIHIDAQLRSNDKWIHMQSLLLRTGVNFHVNKHLTLTVGYAFINNRTVKSTVSRYFSEHRLWQQIILVQPIKNISLQHRFRYEERFIPRVILTNNKLVKDGSLFATRLRYFVRSVLPFTKASPFTKGSYAALQNEIFVNISNANATNNNFFDQNRAYAAIGYRFSKLFDTEIGYLNQYIKGKTLNTSNNVIQLATYVRL